jgi:hypothetical protein
VQIQAQTGSGRAKYHHAKNSQAHSTLGGEFFRASLDISSWLKQHIGNFYEFDNRDSLSHIRDFTIIWSRFEASLCEKKACCKSIRKAIRDLGQSKLDNLDCNKYRNFFINRAEHSIAEYLTKLGLKIPSSLSSPMGSKKNDNDKIYDSIKNLLEGESMNSVEVATALSYICYRIRNNTFHGNKETRSLLDRKVFNAVNHFLVEIIDLKKVESSPSQRSLRGESN